MAALYEPYVTVVASVYRHTPRDYDENGERVICPRLGSVTCGEHIAMEPLLYDKYLDEARVSPRHVVIELDGSESLDIYYAFDTAAVFEAVITSAEGRPDPKPQRFWDLPLVERTGFAGAANREALEQAFRTGNTETRRVLLMRSVQTSRSGGPEQHELWRLALKSGEPELARLAVEGISTSDQAASIDLVLATLQDLKLETDREVMLSTLERIGQSSKRAKDLVAAFRGLEASSGVVDRQAAGEALAVDGGELREQAVDRLAAIETARSTGGATYDASGEVRSDAELALERAQAGLELLRGGKVAARFVPVFQQDLIGDLQAAQPVRETDQAWRWEVVDIALDLMVARGVVDQVAAEDRALEIVPALPPTAAAEGGTALPR